MKIRTSDPSLVDDLREFLRAKGCVVELTSVDTLDVQLPETTRPDAAQLELDLYLRIWEVMNPGATARYERPNPSFFR
jgi:hypothetical protein